MPKLFRKRWFRITAVGVIILIGVGVYLHWPRHYPLTISYETTRLLGPLNADGTVNYVAALNEKYSRGVTPENNAAVLLARAIGPGWFPDETRLKSLTALGMDSLPEEGDYFIPLDEYVRAHAPKEKLTSLTDPPLDPEKVLGRDSVPPEILKLLTHRRTVAEEEAQNDLTKAMKTPWSAKDIPTIAAWLKASSGPLALVTMAVKRPRYYMPLVSNSDPPRLLEASQLHVSLRRIRSVGKALIARAMLKINEGNVESASEDLGTVARLGGHVASGSQQIEDLMGGLLQTMAFEGYRTMAGSGKLSPSQARTILHQVQTMPELPGIADAVDEDLRYSLLDSLGRADPIPDVSSDTEKMRYMDRNAMFRNVNKWCDEFIRASQQEPFFKRYQAMDATCENLNARIMSMSRARAILLTLLGTLTHNERGIVISDFVLCIQLPSFNTASITQDRRRTYHRLTIVALALTACKAERGEYPAELSTLAPDYLKEIPKDIFSDGELKYRREGDGYILYSVGDNMADDGGTDAKTAEFRAADLVVKVK